MPDIPAKDWKLFREKIPGWQASCMESLCREYIELLQQNKRAAERFWQLGERIKTDQRRTGVVIEMRRSMMIHDLAMLLLEEVISEADLAEFTEKTREQAIGLCAFWKEQNENS